MPKERPLEYCDICTEPTGRAGRGEDSIFVTLAMNVGDMKEGDEVGPLCSDCYHAFKQLDQIEAD